jgi:two-component system CheB/CheR fusion protein
MREMAHRSNNLLAVVQSMARQSIRHSKDLPDFDARFQARLHALGSSNNLLLAQNWTGAAIGDLVQTQLAPFVESIRRRVEMNGPPLRLKPVAAQSIALAVHELATNAAKYGALADPSGRISVRWECNGGESKPRRVRITWREHNGPPVTAPMRKGFGHIVIERTVREQLNGEVAYEFAPDGVRWTLDMPASHVEGEE